MWPFSVSNNVVEEKRRQRTVALVDLCDASEAQHGFLKATGPFTNSHIDDDKLAIVLRGSNFSF